MGLCVGEGCVGCGVCVCAKLPGGVLRFRMGTDVRPGIPSTTP